MSSLSTYLKGKLSDLVLRNTAYTPPTTVYLALFLSNPTIAGSGTEASYSGYARQAVAFSAISGATTQNSGTVTFPAVAGSSITVTHFAIYDASSAGNLLLFGALTASKTLDATDVPSFPAGALQLTWN